MAVRPTRHVGSFVIACKASSMMSVKGGTGEGEAPPDAFSENGLPPALLGLLTAGSMRSTPTYTPGE